MTDWKHDGVRVIPAGSLDTNTAQTPGMNRAAAINFARVGAQKLWAGTVHIHANAKTGAHHHGALESVIYVVKGKARMRWGEFGEKLAAQRPFGLAGLTSHVGYEQHKIGRVCEQTVNQTAHQVTVILAQPEHVVPAVAAAVEELAGIHADHGVLAGPGAEAGIDRRLQRSGRQQETPIRRHLHDGRSAPRELGHDRRARGIA